MIKSNGKPSGDKPSRTETLTIIANLDTGQTSIDHPGDLILTQSMLAQAMSGIAAKMAANRAEEAAPKIETTSEASLRRLL